MRIIKVFMAIGIAVVFATFVSYGLHVLYERPRYDFDSGLNTCYKDHDCGYYREECQNERSEVTSKGMNSAESFDIYNECVSTGRQSSKYQNCLESRDQCDKEYTKQTVRYKHARNSFYILVSIGIIAIVVGGLLIGIEVIGSGLLGGGIIVVLWALGYTSIYWFTWNKFVKFGALAVVLAVLIFIAYKKFKKVLNP